MIRLLTTLISFVLVGCALFIPKPEPRTPELRAWTSPRWIGYTSGPSLPVRLFVRVNHYPARELRLVVGWSREVVEFEATEDHSWVLDATRAGVGRHTIEVWIIDGQEIAFYRSLFLEIRSRPGSPLEPLVFS